MTLLEKLYKVKHKTYYKQRYPMFSLKLFWSTSHVSSMHESCHTCISPYVHLTQAWQQLVILSSFTWADWGNQVRGAGGTVKRPESESWCHHFLTLTLWAWLQALVFPNYRTTHTGDINTVTSLLSALLATKPVSPSWISSFPWVIQETQGV